MCTKADLQIARKLVALYSSASDRNIEFDLPFQSLKNIFNAKRCYYTGVEFSNKPNHPLSRTIDRVDNNLGYIAGNVVACTKEFNGKKANLTKDDIRLLARKVL